MMDSIKRVYKIGHGPSSSHMIAPMRASKMFLTQTKELPVDRIKVTLYRSPVATGKGHMTDQTILSMPNPVHPTIILWEPRVELTFHPNGMRLVAFDRGDKELKEFKVYSIGDDTLTNEGFNEQIVMPVYKLSAVTDIIEYLDQRELSYWEYVESYEGPDMWDYLAKVWEVVKQSVHEGLAAEDVLSGGLRLRRKAADTLIKSLSYKGSIKTRGMVYSYALAVSGQSAAGGRVVTAPTYGSYGVTPVVLLYLQEACSFRDERILRALATAGLFASVVHTNASTSGAEIGYQGGMGVTCAMTAAAASQLFGEMLHQVKYTAEMGLERHLGLICNPVCGLVQIPCVKRNTFAASRALGANTYANFTDGRHHVSFDQAVAAIHQTGKNLPSLYKETTEGGLALLHEKYGGKVLIED